MSGAEPLCLIAGNDEQKATGTPDDKLEVGIDVGYSCAIDERRQLSLRTMFPQATPPQVQERVLAQIASVAAIMGLRELVIEHKRESANAQARFDELQADPKRKAEIKAELDALVGSRGEAADNFEKAFRANGRQGQWKPAGKEKGTLDALDRDIERLARESDAIDADLAKKRADLATAIRNWTVAIENAEREIAIRREAYGE